MKKLKLFLPLLFNIILTIFYKYCEYNFLRQQIGYDHVLYADGREVHRFGIGWTSVCFILILFIICTIWIIKHQNLFQKKVGYIISLFLLICIDGFWLLHYIQWYLYPIISLLMDIFM